MKMIIQEIPHSFELKVQTIENKEASTIFQYENITNSI